MAAHKTSVPLVCRPRSSPRKAEHARSYGTAAAQLVKFVVRRQFNEAIYIRSNKKNIATGAKPPITETPPFCANSSFEIIPR